MSSKKGKGIAVDHRHGDDGWSEWVWDDPIQQYYRTRLNPRAKRGYDYEYAPPQVTKQVPRSEAGKTTTITNSYTTSTSANPNADYYEHDKYKYEPTEGPTGSGKAAAPFQSTDSRISSSAPVQSNMEYWNTNRFKATHDKIPEVIQDSPEALVPSFQKLAVNPIPATGSSGLAYGITTSSAGPSSAQGQPDAGIGSSSFLQVPTNTGRHITGTPGDTESLDPKYRLHKSKYFRPGQVFKVIWSEPEGETRSNITNVTTSSFGDGIFGQKVYQSVRRFIVMATPKRGGSSCCIPILTYGHQGTAKPGVNADDHAIVYTDALPPRELQGEPRLYHNPIRVKLKHIRDKFDVQSRINYAKIYTVEHNVKVHFVGELCESSERDCLTAFNNTWFNMNKLPE